MLRQGFEPPPKNTGKRAVSKTAGPTGGPKPQTPDPEALAETLRGLSSEQLAAVVALAAALSGQLPIPAKLGDD
jgi:hypothetical protein